MLLLFWGIVINVLFCVLRFPSIYMFSILLPRWEFMHPNQLQNQDMKKIQFHIYVEKPSVWLILQGNVIILFLSYVKCGRIVIWNRWNQVNETEWLKIRQVNEIASLNWYHITQSETHILLHEAFISRLILVISTLLRKVYTKINTKNEKEKSTKYTG